MYYLLNTDSLLCAAHTKQCALCLWEFLILGIKNQTQSEGLGDII